MDPRGRRCTLTLIACAFRLRCDLLARIEVTARSTSANSNRDTGTAAPFTDVYKHYDKTNKFDFIDERTWGGGGTINANMKVSEQCRIAASEGNQILGMITYKEKGLIVPLYKAIVRPHLEYCIQAWRPYHRNDIDTLEKIRRRATKLISGLRDLSYEERLKECGLTTLETRRLRGDQI